MAAPYDIIEGHRLACSTYDFYASLALYHRKLVDSGRYTFQWLCFKQCHQHSVLRQNDLASRIGVAVAPL